MEKKCKYFHTDFTKRNSIRFKTAIGLHVFFFVAIFRAKKFCESMQPPVFRNVFATKRTEVGPGAAETTENRVTSPLSKTRWWKFGAGPALFLSLCSFNDPFCCRVQLDEVFHIRFPIQTSLLDVSTNLIETQLFSFHCQWTVLAQEAC